MSRPPGSQFGNYLPVTTSRPVKEYKQTEISEATRLRIAIQSFSILYPRAMKQSHRSYADALAKILDEKQLSNGHSHSQLASMAQQQLYGVLDRHRRK